MKTVQCVRPVSERDDDTDVDSSGERDDDMDVDSSGEVVLTIHQNDNSNRPRRNIVRPARLC